MGAFAEIKRAIKIGEICIASTVYMKIVDKFLCDDCSTCKCANNGKCAAALVAIQFQKILREA